MKQWFASLARRERVMVVIAVIFTVTALFYVSIWQPLHQGANNLEQSIQRQQELAMHIAELSATAKQLRAKNRGDFQGQNDTLLAIINQTSHTSELGQSIQRIQPEGQDKAVVRVEQVRFNNMIRWLRTLQMKYGVTVSALNVTRGESQGLVEARMTLERIAG